MLDKFSQKNNPWCNILDNRNFPILEYKNLQNMTIQKCHTLCKLTKRLRRNKWYYESYFSIYILNTKNSKIYSTKTIQ